MKPIASFALICLLFLPLTSCAVECDIFAPLTSLTMHENPVVSYPSQAGAFIGGVAGVPISIAALPITLPIALSQGKGDPNLLPLAPAMIVAELGAILIGGPTWLLFGWWGN